MSNMVGGRALDLAGRMLMTAVSTAGGPAYRDAIDEMDEELTKVTEDFIRAVDVETLHMAKRSGEH